MTKKHIHEIICPSCSSSFWVNDTYSFFNKPQNCSNCNSVIQTGNNGLNEQILIQIKRKASVRVIRMIKDARHCSMRAAKKLVKKVAKENDIKIDTDVTPVLNFFLRIIISGILGLGIVGIGSAFYPEIQKIAAPVVCQGEFKIEVEKELSTKVQGERSKGKEVIATCDDEDISKKTFYASVGIYSVIIFILLTIRRFLMK
jgi:hypothetical protein